MLWLSVNSLFVDLKVILLYSKEIITKISPEMTHLIDVVIYIFLLANHVKSITT